MPCLIPLLGVVTWIVHAVQLFRRRRHNWGGWCCLVTLPLMCFATYACWVAFVPRPKVATMTVSRIDGIFLGNMFLGFFSWITVLVMEPVLHLVRYIWERGGHKRGNHGAGTSAR